MDPTAHSEFYKYTTPLITPLSFDPATSTHIPFRATPHHTHRTWARTYTSHPELYLQPASLPELRLIIHLARQTRKTLTLTGSSHSPSTITQTTSWLINLDNFSRVVSADPTDTTITVEAGIRLHQLLKELDALGWTMRNLGSITEQSVAGAIATGTHGSSLRHGLLSDSVVEITIMLANGELVTCSKDKNTELFRAALVSLGALGVVTHVKFQAVKAFDLRWTQKVVDWTEFVENWDNADWHHHEFARCWWFPYSGKAVVWYADKTEEPRTGRPASWYAEGWRRWGYEAALYVATWFPSLVPVVERWVFRMQYGKLLAGEVVGAVEKSDEALTMDCLFSQLVNEWAIPLHHGPAALRRLTAWLTHDLKSANIPISPSNIFVHAPIEVRVSNTCPTDPTTSAFETPRPFLDQSIVPSALLSPSSLSTSTTAEGGATEKTVSSPAGSESPTLYLNATLYRPFHRNPPHWQRYYTAFELLMKEYGGKPHWAKNCVSVGREEWAGMYGEGMRRWREVRRGVDPEGVFVGEWLSGCVLGEEKEVQ
ncbi:L-gulonolactone/D-arabinono-1,4-lactone oxidase [Ascodesmis nigricans]|uniref:D-arabinono-1,4-lactone oxidase n=1 Tax=Ascodesmis nigricans TaxID=341454 RepID=A0A4S2MQK8_9PEZI|nr:L-gulonolactone/D-arabinono-1,4-lactone oxidase [Ascodesmis nigricans]